MIRNKFISLAVWVVCWWSCLFSRIIYLMLKIGCWFEERRLSRCRQCYSWVKSSWEVCPICGQDVLETLEQEDRMLIFSENPTMEEWDSLYETE